MLKKSERAMLTAICLGNRIVGFLKIEIFWDILIHRISPIYVRK